MISAILITKNEENNLARCLENIKWADEIIVVDSGSTDKTAEIAKKFGAKVFENQWSGYGAQKNFAIDKTTNNWVLSIDADEVVTSELQKEIEKIIQIPGEYVAFKMPRKLIFQGKFLRWGGCYPNYQVRLFRKSKARFSHDLVHEKLIVDGKIGCLRGSLVHYSYKDLSDYLKRLNLYTTLDAQKRFSSGKKFHSRYYIQPLFKFFSMYFLRLGFLDGLPGLNWAILSSFYDFVKFQKLRELCK